MRRCLFPFAESPHVLVPVVRRAGFRFDPHRDADLGKVAKEIKMPIDHGHLQAVRQPDAGGFADLVAPAVLQHSQHNHHNHGDNDHAGRKSALFDQ